MAERATLSPTGAEHDTFQGQLADAKSDLQSLFVTLDKTTQAQVQFQLRTGVPDEVLVKVSWRPAPSTMDLKRIEFQYWSTEPHLLSEPAKTIVSQIHSLRPKMWATNPPSKPQPKR